MGRVSKGVKCAVIGCEKDAVRSLSTEKASSAGLDVEQAKRAYLCKEHYKQFKKESRKDRMLERWRYRT